MDCDLMGKELDGLTAKPPPLLRESISSTFVDAAHTSFPV